MLIPNGENAIVDIKKLRDYCLNLDNPRGSNKARVFAAALGITAEMAEELRQLLLEAATCCEATLGEADFYGQRYIIDFVLTRPPKQAIVRSSWIILNDEQRPRLVTCYVLKRKPSDDKKD